VGRFNENIGVDLLGGAPSDVETGGTFYILLDLPDETSAAATALAEVTEFITEGEGATSSLGRFATNLGDFDGDGLEDIAFSDPFFAANYSGKVYLVRGADVADGPPLNDVIEILGDPAGDNNNFGTGLGSLLSSSPRGWGNLASQAWE
jgi:hypothetical protein